MIYWDVIDFDIPESQNLCCRLDPQESHDLIGDIWSLVLSKTCGSCFYMLVVLISPRIYLNSLDSKFFKISCFVVQICFRTRKFSIMYNIFICAFMIL